MRKVNKIIRSVILMLLGAAIYGLIIEAAKVYGSRSAGNFGGEIFVLPLMIGLVCMAWVGAQSKHKS